MNTPQENFRKNLSRIMYEKGKSQTELSKALGVPFQSVNNWVLGVATPRMGRIQRIAEYFGVEIADLLEEPKEKLPTCDKMKECQDCGACEMVDWFVRLDQGDRQVVEMMIETMLGSDKYKK